MPRFNYIVTVHNQEMLIAQVVNALLVCAGRDSHVYLVLDGCSDRTEDVVDSMLSAWDGLPLSKLYANDVHEILSINTALSQVPQTGDGYNIIVQDDVILGDRNFEARIERVYEHYSGAIGMLSFRHGVNLALDDRARDIVEIDMVESCYAPGFTRTPLLPGQATRRMVAVRSPECISFATVRAVGVMDAAYAPFTYDNHEYSLRCVAAGLHNIVYAVNVTSRVQWGGMRRAPQPNVAAIMRRNSKRVYDTYAGLVRSLDIGDFRRPPIRFTDAYSRRDDAEALRLFNASRELLQQYTRPARVKTSIRQLGRQLRRIAAVVSR